MIYIFAEKNSQLTLLKENLSAQKIPCRYISNNHLNAIAYLHEPKVRNSIQAIIAEDQIHNIHLDMWIDLLEGLAKQLPTLVITAGSNESITRLNQSSLLSFFTNPQMEEMLDFLKSCGVLDKHQRPFYKNMIPLYSHVISSRILKNNGFLSIISIHAADFSRISLEYGSAVYQQLQFALQKILYELWGTAFRKTDILCRKAVQSNTFYILLERSRSDQSMTVPGDLEILADRISLKLENLMWKEINSASHERILPKFLDIVPRFIVGYASTLFNQCVDPLKTTEELLQLCRETAKVQDQRMLCRQRELIQTLIQAEGLLTTHFQGVFDLRKLTREELYSLKDQSGLTMIPHTLHSFEALARIHKPGLQKLVNEDMSLNVDYLNPGVLFARAEEVNLKLELDQACFRLSIQNFVGMPGKLMLNILPRNFYFIDELQHVIPKGLQIIFEVSETEAINNMSLTQKIRDKIAESSHGIAIDDFGKGYAGVDRIIKIQPTIIKLDQILISEIDKDIRMQSFIKGLVEAARSTQSLVLAEGVETHEELITLAEMGIELAQGYYLHKPNSAENVINELKNKKKSLKTVA